MLRALTVTAAAFAVAACGSTGTVTPPPTRPGATPTASARPVSATGFTTIIPPGWTDDTHNESAVAAVQGDGTVVLLLTAPDGGHIDVRVVAQPVPDDQLSTYLGTVSSSGATHISATQAFNVGGNDGVYVTYDLTSSTGAALMDQDMVVDHGGDTYDIVLNTGATSFASDALSLQRVLEGWAWSAQ